MTRSENKINATEVVSTIAWCILLIGIWKHSQRAFILAAAFLTIALYAKALARYLANAWLQLGELLGVINGRVLLTLVFFLVLTPLAFAQKLLGKDTLRLKKPIRMKSLWLEREKSYEPKDFETLW